MHPLEALSLSPKRDERELPDGSWEVTVTPPHFFHLPGRTLTLTHDQHVRYKQWRDGRMMIQEALPELSISEREILMTGLGDADFKRFAGDPEEE